MSTFPRFSFHVDALQLQVLVGAGQRWLHGKLTTAGALPLEHVAALEPLRRCIVRYHGQHHKLRMSMRAPRRRQHIRLTATPAEAAAMLCCLPEDLLGDEWLLPLRVVRGLLHQQLLNFPCINLESFHQWTEEDYRRYRANAMTFDFE